MVNKWDFNTIKMLDEDVSIDKEEKLNTAINMQSKIKNILETEIVPNVKILNDNINLDSIIFYISRNKDKEIVYRSYSDLYRLIDYKIFSESLNLFREKIINKGLFKVNPDAVRKMMFNGEEFVEKITEIFNSENDIKSYYRHLTSVLSKEFYIIKDDLNQAISNLAIMMIDLQIYSDLYHVFTTVHNTSIPFTSDQPKIENLNIGTESFIYSYEAKDNKEEKNKEEEDNDEFDKENDGNSGKIDKSKKGNDAKGSKDKENEDDSDTEEGDNILQKIGKATSSFFSKTKEKIISIPRKLSVAQKRFKMFRQSRKNLAFYKKYRGKFEGLYNEYGDIVEIEENKMRDDPVKVLFDVAAEYVINLGKRVCELADEVQELSVQINQTTSFEKKMEIAKKYAKDAPDKDENGEDTKEDKIGKRIYLATKRKLAKIILDSPDFRIYGFTENSMTVGPLPPPNHLIVSIFVANPYQSPTKQSVKDIFSSWESFELMADSTKQKALAINELASSIMRNSITTKTFKNIEENRKNQYNQFVNNLKSSNGENRKELKRQQKEIKKIMNGISESVKAMANAKIYLMDCINIYFSMIIRIDDLVKKTVEALLEEEKKHVDIRYNNQLGSGKAGSNLELDMVQNPEKYGGKKDEEEY